MSAKLHPNHGFAVDHGSHESCENTRYAIREHEPFKTSGALTGDRYGAYQGRLSGPARERFFNDANNIDYFVYSYGTPIAWHLKTPTESGVQWVLVLDKFSQTTSKHQSAVRSALGGYGLRSVAAEPIEYEIAWE